MKATAIAPSNIAFVKYWGKNDDKLRLPANSSFSMNLDGAHTTTTVEFMRALPKDDITSVDGDFTEKEINRIAAHLDNIRSLAKIQIPAKVVTKNSFPKGAGAASSASGFAALTVAGTKAAGLALDEKELTILARTGSGSACRSIPDGFVFWEKGDSSETSFAYSLYPARYWNLCDVLLIVDASMKKVPTTEGHEGAYTSPFFKQRLDRIDNTLKELKLAFEKKDFSKLGELIELESLDMHHVMQTQNPPLYYWNGVTEGIMSLTKKWRKDGIPVYFTIDAGPNVHLICESENAERVMQLGGSVEGVINCIVNKVSAGTKLIDSHLF